MAETLGRQQPAQEADRPGSAADPTPGWRLWLPPGVESGVHAETPGDPSGLLHVGENWAVPRHRVVEHRHPGWEFYLQLHGGSSWRFAGRHLRLAPGWLVAVPPGLPHRTVPRPEGGVRQHFAYAAVDLRVLRARRPELAAAWTGAGVRVCADARAAAPALRAVVREVVGDLPFGAVARAAAVELLVVEVTRLLGPRATARRRLPGHPAVAHARRLLDEQYAAAWRLADLAAACALSRTRLAELFVAEVGQPPYAYLLERRVERAAELLATTGASVARIAAEVGFSSHTQLARAFRRRHGCPPTRWRHDAARR
ncbi:AraC family transcriptional regulator [Micromonospora sp. NPDC050980]|uniref:AraC family transcriptional regulator n=1 Tax=Micromonospora sp. NPDC050980 TaxID=3155161 RepID=UPI0033FE0F30